MIKVQKTYLNGPFGQVHTRLAGENSSHLPLMCLHMSPKSGRSYHRILPLLAEKRFVMAPDYPGYGESDLPPEDPPVEIEDYARTCWAVADQLDIPTLDLLGHHTGSKVAVEMTHQQPERVRRLVLISTVILTPEEQQKFTAAYQPIPLDMEGTRFKTLWERIVEHRGPEMTLEMMAEGLAENLRGGEAYEWGHRAAFAYNDRFPGRIKKLLHPITVINPKDDLHAITPRAMGLIQNGQLIEKPQWGHGFLDAHTEDAAATILKVLT